MDTGPGKNHEAQALARANAGIAASAAGDHAASAQAWRAAFDYAERHLPDADICFWIRDGLGAALYETGDYDGALAMAGSALVWCARHRAPQAALTLAKSSLRRGDVELARDYARQAVGLRGAAVLKAFSAGDRATLGEIAPP